MYTDHTHIHIHTYIQTLTHTYTHTLVHTHTHTHTYTHTRCKLTCSNPNHGIASVFSFVLKTFAAAFLVFEGKGFPSGV